MGSLLTKSSKFDLLKYFVAYLKIKSNGEFEGEVKDFIIATNADFDFTDSILHPVRKLRMMSSGKNKEKEISVIRVDTQDEFLDMGNGARYRINDSYGSIPQYLEQHVDFIKREVGREVSDEEIEGFLNELVFAVNQPNEDQLEELIKDEISNELARKFKYFGDNEFAYYAFFMMVLGWMKDREGRFLSPKEGREFFQKVELWASTVSEIRQGVERIEGKVDEIGEVLSNQQARKEPIRFNMRYPVKIFTGRENKLQEIYDKLHKGTGKLTAISRIVVISGLGGVGKSELARKYAYEYRKDYDGNVIWINAETQKDLEESFEGLARELNRREGSKISTTEEGIESIIEGVYRYFEDVKGLFIFDSAEGYKNISKFLPSSLNYRPYVLITSRDTKWKLGQKIEMEVTKLDVFEEPEALEFVEKFLDIDNASQDKEIEELAEELQCFPLALKQAVAYIRNKNKESKLRDYGRFEISDYLKEYQQHPEKLLKEGVYGNEECYTKTIFTTWDVTIEAIKRKECGIEALSILEIMAYLALDDICIKEIFPKSMADDKKKLWNAVKLLDRHSMINLRKRTVNIRRLVQKVIRLKLQEKGQEEETLRKALELINSNDVVKEDVSHIVSVWEYASKHGKLIDEFYFSSIYVRKVMFSKENKESNPLHLLAEGGSCKAIIAILTHVEKRHLNKLREVINIKDNRGQTLLHIAAYNRKLDVVEYLISKGADLSAKDKLNGTPLHSAAEGGNYEVVKAVLTHTEKKTFRWT